MFGRRLRLAFAACAALLLAQAASTRAQVAGGPVDGPVAEGEEVIPMRNCAMVVKTADVTDRTALFNAYAPLEWTGECRYGLAHGWGAMGKPEDLASLRASGARPLEWETYYGRMLGNMRGSVFGGTGESFSFGGKGVSISNVGAGYAPIWGQMLSAAGPQPSNIQISQSPNYRVVGTWMQDCTYWDRESWTPEQRRANAACRQGAQYMTYGVYESDQGGQQRVTYCPDPRTSAGCEPLWREKLGTLLAEAEEIRSAALAQRERTIAEVRPLVSQYEARLAAAERDRREAAARAAAEAQAEAERLDAEFQKSLATKNAGQLFALSDELRAAGETDKARATLRALVSRFPDHPLAVTAAQQMSQMGSSPGGMASVGRTPIPGQGNPPSSTASPRGESAACANAAAEEERLGQLAYNSGQKFPGEVVRPMESLLWAVAEIQKLYRSCPSLPESAAKLQTYDKLYGDTINTCSAMASAPPCRARLH